LFYSFIMCCPIAAQDVGPATGRPMVTRVAARLRRHEGMDPGADCGAARNCCDFFGITAAPALATFGCSYHISVSSTLTVCLALFLGAAALELVGALRLLAADTLPPLDAAASAASFSASER